jgi:5-methylcytosine-specific restriction protein A
MFGTACSVCGFDFERAYGDIGAGFIHVHHLMPLSMIGKRYSVNVRRDLRPVCPNCHEMLHKKKPPFSVEELRARISR